jgi:protein SCO1/2
MASGPTTSGGHPSRSSGVIDKDKTPGAEHLGRPLISLLKPLRAPTQRLKPIAASLVLLAASASTIAAHSLGELDAQLRDREKYFQPIDQDAPAFTLQDAEGRAVSLEDLRGRVVVLHFIYTSCPDVCPLHAERIAEIQEMVNRTPMREVVQFVTITTDPEHDTPEVMRQYGSAHGLDPVNWVFLKTTLDQPEDATRKLAKRFGHGFTNTKDGDQIHGVVTHIIDRKGRWQANFHGLEFEPTNLIVYVNALVNDAGRPHAHAPQSFWEAIRGWF